MNDDGTAVRAQPDAAVDQRFSRELTGLSSGLRRFARYLTRDEVAADDLVQDTMLRAWHYRRSFVFGTSMRAWTFTILRRLHLSGRRRLKFVGTYDEAVERSLFVDEGQSIFLDVQDVRRALARLPDHQREAIQVIAIDELTFEEAAQRLSIPLGTVKSRVIRGRRALATALEGDEPRRTC